MLWQWLQHLGPGEWAILGIVLILLELATSTAYLLWVGLAALTLAALLLIAPLPAAAQYLLFAGLSLVITLIGRRYYNPRQVSSDQPGLNQLGQRHVGGRYPLDDDAVGGRGVVKIGDSRWQVTLEGCDSLAKGTLVEVVAQHDTRLVVRPLPPV